MSDTELVVVSMVYLMCCCAVMVCGVCILMTRMRGTPGVVYGDVRDLWQSMGTSSTTSWTSPSYGTMKGTPIGSTCPSGSYVSDIIGFSGENSATNALQAWCWDPKLKKLTTRIFANKPTCGKRDRPDAKAIAMIAFTPITAVAAAALTILFPPAGALAWTAVATSVAGTLASVGMEIASGVDVSKDILKPQSGRALWDFALAGTPAGWNRWSVRPKDGEIKGLRFDAVDGKTTGWIGGGDGKTFSSAGVEKSQPSGKITTQSCPRGTILTGIKASCGDRVDGIQFTCGRPPM